MARNHRIAWSDDPSLYEVEICSANAADRNPHQDLTVRGSWVGEIRGFEQ
jgi:hypothetical protein